MACIFAEIRSWWEVPSIAHFCSLFRAAFGLTDFEIEVTEISLVNSPSVSDYNNSKKPPFCLIGCFVLRASS